MLVFKRKKYIFIRCELFLSAVLLILLSLVTMVTAEGIKSNYSINGIWKLDVAMTVRSRIIKGIPWHIGDRYGMSDGIKIIREFDNNKFRLYDEETGEVVENGTLQIVESKKNEIVLRVFPEGNRYNINNYKLEELVRLTRYAGENVLGIIGLKFLDSNTVESFSYVKDFGKDKMIKKYDNAYWKRIEKIPNRVR